MSPKAARTVRAVLGLPRLTKDMTSLQRRQYRFAKRSYLKVPAPERSTFLDSVSSLIRTFNQRIAAAGAASATESSSSSNA